MAGIVEGRIVSVDDVRQACVVKLDRCYVYHSNRHSEGCYSFDLFHIGVRDLKQYLTLRNRVEIPTDVMDRIAQLNLSHIRKHLMEDNGKYLLSKPLNDEEILKFLK